MLDNTRAWLLGQIRAAKPSFISKQPHFNFISAHYFWIVSLTILASVLMYATAGGQLAYIDALFFASGANTQAGLNTVDVNLLNTFQQICIYIFTMTSNPIVIHSSVVFLRLYWFEKRFQNMVRDARARRVTISKSRAKAHLDMNQAEMGVAGRNIRIMPNSGSRITNDGIILDKKVENGGRESPSSNHTAVPSSSDTDDSRRSGANGHSERPSSGDTAARSSYTPRTARSDDIELDSIHGPRRLSHAEHLAILERQRRGYDETLRIPNPRDVEKGIKPKRVEEGDAPEAEEEEDPNQPGIRSPGNTRPNTPPEGVNPRNRQPTIKIFEPQKPSERRQRPAQQNEESPERDTMDELAEKATVIGNVLDSVMFRKPRIFQRGQKKYHVDSDEDENDGPRPGPKHRTRTLDVLRGALTGEKADDAPYLSWTPTLGRNSQFPGLSLEQREELGGIEYRSLRTLALLLVCYFWGWSIFALVCLLPWIKSPSNNEYAQVVDAAGMSRTWWGFFTANSAFLDLGLTLTPDSMVSFNQSQYVLMIMVFLIIIGNTGFPVMLRSIIWVMARLVPRGSGLWEELRFLLDHPRRCFTLLFPASATWWLFWILIGLNAIDLLFFVLLDLNDNVVSDMPVHLRIVNGLFQAACTRTAGFSSVNLSLLHPAVQVSYMMMMYISVFPIAISIRRTNVYEEKSLGVYNSAEDDETINDASAMSYVGTHLRRQLSFDLWYVFLGLFILSITEGSKIKKNEFNVYSILFELISAYGTVGLSLGYPNVNASLSSQFTTGGKLVIIAMQIRGRHRGLPYGLDRAVLLPSEARFADEALETQNGLTRQMTAVTNRTGADLQRGRSRDRGIISSFLHPGPAVPREDRNLARRVSFDAGVSASGANGTEGPDLRRRHTVAVEDADTDEDEEIAPAARARRVFTTPMG
ncbi:hypothetical protein VD0004_g3569 [Verticillium dahliae]|uniref:Potassium transport protein n=1 Tax=Verticillium dahliae TaxID=27337 RepID=A0A444RKS9_VERDA|nr:hypothetical protein VD0004_g3569 [Verticillium dahliae]PNH72161.1 hypothetical protein VD0001_g5398 [Verticillium dahliae]RXG41752.1 hypothetical protein VDGE_03751 [Verticillium dahliae]